MTYTLEIHCSQASWRAKLYAHPTDDPAAPAGESGLEFDSPLALLEWLEEQAEQPQKKAADLP